MNQKAYSVFTPANYSDYPYSWWFFLVYILFLVTSLLVISLIFVTSLLVTPLPVTSLLVTPLPVTPLPVTSLPVTPLPVTRLPVTPLPVTPLLVASMLICSLLIISPCPLVDGQQILQQICSPSCHSCLGPGSRVHDRSGHQVLHSFCLLLLRCTWR